MYITTSLDNRMAGVTRIELASAVLETVALPLCYTPIDCALLLLHKSLIIFNANQFVFAISQFHFEIWLMINDFWKE